MGVDLFGASVPPGLDYGAEIVTSAEERALIAAIDASGLEKLGRPSMTV